jgi:signal transduction histidine kinase
LLDKTGSVYLNDSKSDQALLNFSNALVINSEIGNQFGIALNHVNIAAAYHAKGNYKKMGEHLDLGIQYAIETKVDHLILRYYHYYIQHCEATHNHAGAHTFFNKYLPLSQKVNQATINNLTALLIELHKNELDKNKAFYIQEINLRQLERERDELRISQMILFIILVALIAMVSATLYFNKIRTARKLTRLVDERTRKLKENEQKLIEVNATREKFYSIIAHDLKSPFNSLIGFSNLLLDDYDSFTNEERKEFIKIMNESSENIFNLLENLLDWTRRSSDRFELKPVKIDLNQSIKRTLQLQEKNAISKQITINNRVPKNSIAFADENAVFTILRNLLSNAIKFTPQKGTITIKAEKFDAQIHCTVSDTGTGLSKTEMDKILDTTKTISKKGTGQEKGTGLGLALVKDFVEQSGGKLTIKSKINEGSHFTFSLPTK